MDQAERRRYTRVGFAGDATIEQDESRFNVHLIDISLNGVLIETPDVYTLKADQPITVNVTLAGDVEISMHVKLVHSSHNQLGFQCESIDMESMTHLRRLMELNMEDPSACERVLDELLMPH